MKILIKQITKNTMVIVKIKKIHLIYLKKVFAFKIKI